MDKKDNFNDSLENKNFDEDSALSEFVSTDEATDKPNVENYDENTMTTEFNKDETCGEVDVKKKSIKDRLLECLKDKRKRHGTVLTVVTVLVIAVAILMNVGASALDKKFGLSLDFTKNKIFKLTDQSKDYIQSLNKDIEIDVLASEEKFTSGNDYFVQANSVINEYSRNSDKISLKYIDLEQNPTYASDYKDENVSEGDVIVKSGDKYKVVTNSELFDVQLSYYGSNITASKAEQALTSAIMYVASEGTTKVAIVTGYNEADYSGFESLLKSNNYEVDVVDVLTSDIPSDASMAVIFAPERDWDDDGISKLNKYLNNDGNYGKNVLVVLESQANIPEKLNSLLESFSVRIKDGIVFDKNTQNLIVSGNPYIVKDEYVDEEFTKNLQNKNIPVTIPYARALEILDSSKVRTLIQSFAGSSGVVPSNASEDWEPNEDDMKNSIPLVVFSKRDDNSTLAVVSSSGAFNPQILARTSLNNSAYFVNAINIITGKENVGITIESKSIESNDLPMSIMQANVLIVVFTVVLPLAMLIAGLIVWLRRRNL